MYLRKVLGMSLLLAGDVGSALEAHHMGMSSFVDGPLFAMDFRGNQNSKPHSVGRGSLF